MQVCKEIWFFSWGYFTEDLGIFSNQIAPNRRLVHILPTSHPSGIRQNLPHLAGLHKFLYSCKFGLDVNVCLIFFLDAESHYICRFLLVHVYIADA